MKTKKYFSIVITILFAFLANAQTVTLYTPSGSSVQAFMQSEMSASDITYYTNAYRTGYPQATVLANASSTYNCHSYAWNISEGGTSICWLNQAPDLHKYWDDFSYEETTEANAEKIFYFNGDHSAIKSTTVAGKYESKWGAMPKMRHAPDYGPNSYNMSYRRYYAKFSSLHPISGSSQLCSQGTYTINNLPAGATVAWSASPYGIVTIQQNGNSATLTKVGSGTISLSATINNSITVTKDIWVGPQASFSGSASVNYLGTGTWYSNASCGAEPYIYQWWLRKANTGVASMCVSNDPELTLRSVAQGTAKLAQSTKPPIVNQPVSYTIFYMFLRVTDASGFQYDTPEQQIYAYGKVDLVPALLLKANNDIQVSDQVKSMEIFPNPASSEVKISVNPTSSSSLHVVSSNSSDNTNLNSYSVNVIDVYGSIVYTDTKIAEQFTIPISKLRNGVYSVIVSDGTNTYQNKLIVKH